jgi:heptaprenyl diphosphate synthase
MAASCRIGAITGGAPRPEIEAYTTFGRCFGMVFQLRDDILDVIASDGELGKPAGQDLAEGIYTLPVLLALSEENAGRELRAMLGQPLGQPDRDKARAVVSASTAIATTVAAGRRYAEQAAKAAEGVGSPALASGLARLAHALLDDLPG